MKLCASPRNTSCVYQLIARDQADPDDAPDAYNALWAFLTARLDPNDLGEAQALLSQFLDKTDEPVSGTGGGLSMDERVAIPAICAGKSLARQYSFNLRFPDSTRIRTLG